MSLVTLESLESRRLLAGAELDPTFGGDGRALQPFASGRLLGLQPDGKIIFSRYVGSTGGNELMRLNPDGSPDSTFLGGKIKDFPHTGSHRVNPFDGRIAYRQVINGVGRISVLRADGTRDASFSGDGILELVDPNFGFSDFEWQGPNLLIAGQEIRRIKSDGTFDNTFAGDGTLGLEFVNDHGIQLDAAGRIYVLDDEFFRNDQPSSTHFWSSVTQSNVTRFTADGILDTAYGHDGTAVANQTQPSFLFSRPVPNHYTWMFHVAGDGSVYHILPDGVHEEDGDTWEMFSSLNPDGERSESRKYHYTDRAAARDDFLGLRSQLSLHAAPDDKLYLAGLANGGMGWQIVRFNQDLTIDRGYGENGTATLDLAVNSVSPPRMQSDGKLLFGSNRLAEDSPFEIDRYIAEPDLTPTVTLNAKGTLIATTSAAGDNVSMNIRIRDGRLILRVGDFVQSFAPSKVKRIALYLGGGNDTLTIHPGVKGVYADGGDGNDTLSGGEGGDVLLGGTGADQIFGFDGNDTLLGGGGSDYAVGGAGNDDLFGNGGADTLSGAGGNDRLFGGPDDADWIKGGSGNDSAADDQKDRYDGTIETMLA